MNITIWPIHIAAFLTFAILVVAYYWPVSKPTGGMFDFGATIDGMMHAVCAVIATLVVWLVYFATK